MAHIDNIITALGDITEQEAETFAEYCATHGIILEDRDNNMTARREETDEILTFEALLDVLNTALDLE